MTDQVNGSGSASNAGISTEPGPVADLEAERQAELDGATRAYEKAKVQLEAAKQRLAEAKKGMN